MSAALTRVIRKEFDTYTLTSPTWMERWHNEQSCDPEAVIHSPELYAIWAIKQECVSLAIAENPFNHDWFVWCDIGIQRHTDKQHLYMTFTDAIPEVCVPDTIHFLEVVPIPDQFTHRWGQTPMIWPPPSITLGGGCIVGNRAAWETFSREYVSMLDKFRARKWFSGKVQIVFFAMLMEKVMPFRLFHATRTTATKEICDHWMSFPIILGGQASAVIDTRFI